jgi:peptide-methionine (S)-S-oxide reductase
MTQLSSDLPVRDDLQRATFAAGCFWGVEAAFRELGGVLDVSVGYTGGATSDPTYEQVCGGSTGHAEAVEVIFDPAAVGYRQIVRPHQGGRRLPLLGLRGGALLLGYRVRLGHRLAEFHRSG